MVETRSSAGSSLMRKRKVVQRPLAFALLATTVVGVGALGTTTASAQEGPGECAVNYVISQDITFSWSQAEFDSAKQQIQNATQLFEGTGVPATASLAAWGRIAPLATAPPLLGVDIESAAGNQQMRDASAAYGYHSIDSGGTNWQTGLAWAESYAEAQGAKDIVFITDGVPNSYTDSAGVFHTNLGGATVDNMAAAQAAGAVADSIRAKGYNLHIVFARTSATGGGGLGDTVFPADPALVKQTMQEIDPGWSIDNVVSVDQIGQKILDATLSECDPSINLTKSHTAQDVEDVNGNGRIDAGDKVIFTFVGTNDGNTALTNVVVTDPKLAAAGVALAGGGSLGNLAVGESKTIKSDPYTLTVADEEAGTFVNVADIKGDSPKGPVTDEDDDTVPLEPGNPSILLEKTHAATDVEDVNGNGINDEGDKIIFTFTTTNNGDLDLTNTTITDPKLAAAGVGLQNGGVVGDLAVGESKSIKSEAYTLTKADVDAGSFLNVATVTADSPRNPVTDEDDDTVPLEPGNPSILLEKTHAATDVEDVNGNGINDEGDKIVFTFTTTNNGDLDLTNTTITDPKLAAAGVGLQNGGVVGDLAVGESKSIKSEAYTLTKADVDAGSFLNVATVTADSPRNPVTDEDDDRVPAQPGTPGIQITKSHEATDVTDVNADGVTNVGDTVVFTFVGTNNGNLPLTEVTISDDILASFGVGLENGGVVGNLAIGASATLKSEPYTLTQADVDAGKFDNVADIVGQSTRGPVTDEDDDTVPTDGNPGISLEKSHDPEKIVDVNGNGKLDAGDLVTYLFKGTNTGDLTIDNAIVTDADLGAAGIGLINGGALGTLQVGESKTVESEPYAVTQADVDRGEFLNHAVINGDTPKGPVTDDDDDKIIPDQDPAIQIIKSHDPAAIVDNNGNGFTDLGDDIIFDFEVTNIGNLTVTDGVVTDEMLAAAGVALEGDGVLPTMAPGDVVNLKSEAYTVTQADVDAKGIFNVAIVKGDTPGGPVEDDDDDEVPTKGIPGITIEKSHETANYLDTNGNGTLGDAGDQVSFDLKVENVGSYTSKNTVVTDEKLAAAGVKIEKDGIIGDMAPGEIVTLKTDPYTITQADVDAGEFINIAKVTGDTPDGPHGDEDDDRVPTKEVPPVPVKTVDLAGTGDGAVPLFVPGGIVALILMAGAVLGIKKFRDRKDAQASTPEGLTD